MDSRTGAGSTWLGEKLWMLQHLGLRFVVPFAAIAALLSCVQDNPRLRTADALSRNTGLRTGPLLLHGLLLAALGLLTYSFYGHRGLILPLPVAAVAWLAVAVAGLLALFAALAPWPVWRAAITALGYTWLYAAVAAAVAIFAMGYSQMLWASTAGITFQLVTDVLHPLLPQLEANPQTRVLDTGNFSVWVSDLCSGLESAGLMLALLTAWLIYFRREYRFPHALLIAPASLLVLFLFNVLRIALLVLIGNAGYVDIASYGFHSQAGWIAFNATACGMIYLSRKIPWITVQQETAALPRASNPTATYLLPFLAILAAGMVSHAASGSFETLYPLRLVAAVIALWFCRQGLREIDWRCSWQALATGAGVFAVWLLASRYLLQPSGIPDALAAFSPGGRGLWIASHALASVVTVPIAEELAYRGFLMRRIASAEFQTLPYRQVGWMGLLVSSVVFGLSHGSLWAPGVLAGLAYGLLVMRSGRIGDSVAAHATTNALIVATVLLEQRWQLW